MADEFCFALLRSTTLQVLKAVGFDSAHKHPTDTLTDVLAQYIQSLAVAMSAYAHLSGRAMGSAYEVGDAINDMAIDLGTLEEWLETDGKALLPYWSEQSDPARFIEGMIGQGRASSGDDLVYEYKALTSDTNDDDEEDKEEEDLPVPKTPILHHSSLPSHIPAYFPPFPEPPKEEEEEELRTLPPLPISALTLTPMAAAARSHTLPAIGRTRNRPAENPFTHLTTFEESALAAAASVTDTASSTEGDQSLEMQPPLSLSLLAEHRKDDLIISESNTRKRRNDTVAVREIMDELQSKGSSAGTDTNKGAPQFSFPQLPRVFSEISQDEAAAGNNMFTNRSSALERLMQHIALPMSVSVLSSPNLLVDMAITSYQGGGVSDPNAVPQDAPGDEGSSTSGPSDDLDLLTADDEAQDNGLPPLTPISLASLSKAKKRKTSKKLTISLPKPTSLSGAASAGSAKRSSQSSSTPSTATPKIRFTIKAPSSAKPTSTPSEMQSLPTKDANTTDEIRCICTNPTVDDGYFMIACDRCGVWFHGGCVNKSESDPSEDWICKRCLALIASPTPDPTPTSSSTIITPAPLIEKNKM